MAGLERCSLERSTRALV
ncbi:hypothetical protein EI555_003295 [Monodon monoceros]|uniref:Uncharacterized protein n=1 Tax=Monodon monoceros TaxID=40151 RepID=A0A4U1EQY4_MONMO|nr:hypothetical protein EI555_003295 [Monodon monoceros]